MPVMYFLNHMRWNDRDKNRERNISGLKCNGVTSNGWKSINSVQALNFNGYSVMSTKLPSMFPWKYIQIPPLEFQIN